MKTIRYERALHGSLHYPEGFEEMLDGLGIKEQLNYFRIGNGLYRHKPVAERRKCSCDYSNRLEDEADVKAIILQNEKVAGVMVKDCHNELISCLPEQGYLIRDDEELDGSGYKVFKLYNYLICVPKQFDSNSN